MTIMPHHLTPVADDLYVWMPPERGWGLANCGLLVGNPSSVWIDTPYDKRLAGRFLSLSQALLPAGAAIDKVVVTHANGDHFWGAGVVPDAEVIAARAAQEHIALEPGPQELHELLAAVDRGSRVGGYLTEHFGVFDWSDTAPVTPTTVFDGELELRAGSHTVELTVLPAAHTAGDVIAYLPAQRTVFSGDVIFGTTSENPGDHPVHWAGPLDNIIGACRRVLATGARTIVPGHGPLLLPSDVHDHIDYLSYVRDRTHALHSAGVPALDAARRIISEGRYDQLGLAERLVVTVGSEYRHLDGSAQTGVVESVALMAEVAADTAATASGTA
ncbi:MBL fold metallo-hydrolase [Streptomyces tsukubensis]|uniref:MBL fold metallo-hydrolase n=1 Tax=Streptomyces tsukubensis TaxID=83656 RepID=A0A1V4AGR0_9ACTN|nr:MBL fold metallo-hydrolase [Streptomyces tsukubensis]OON82868.1 MBL fold metallo-hydrolase [Streptomyces tsukubensis]QFR91953.1 MBL fold metallo-hydrolase [Streptomyces tsukubensis]